MNITTDEWISAIETHDGKPIDSRLVSFMEDMVKATTLFTELGRKDATANLPPFSDRAFQEWAKSKLPNAPGIAVLIAAFVQEFYMDAYKEYAK